MLHPQGFEDPWERALLRGRELKAGVPLAEQVLQRGGAEQPSSQGAGALEQLPQSKCTLMRWDWSCWSSNRALLCLP